MVAMMVSKRVHRKAEQLADVLDSMKGIIYWAALMVAKMDAIWDIEMVEYWEL